MANKTHEPAVTLTTLFKTFSLYYFTVQQPHSTRKLHIAAIVTQVSFLPPDCVIKVARTANYKEHKTSPKLVNMANQTSPPTSELSFGLQDIKNMNKLSGVKCCLK